VQSLVAGDQLIADRERYDRAVSTRQGVAAIIGVVGVLALSQVLPNLLSTGRPGGLRELSDQGCEHANAIPHGSVGDAAAATFCLLNAQRRIHGLKPLRVEGHLDAASERYARMLVQRHWFEHVTPEGVTPLQRMLAAGFDRDAVAQSGRTWPGGPARPPARCRSSTAGCTAWAPRQHPAKAVSPDRHRHRDRWREARCPRPGRRDLCH
jgi:uncharacterized protein YkwD